jgi:hypothetical protein
LEPGPVMQSFLSRVYPDIGSCLESYPSVVRALRKVNTIVVHKDMPQGEKDLRLRVKAEACARINGHVPLVGPYVRFLASGASSLYDDKGQATKEVAKVLSTDAELSKTWNRLSTVSAVKLSAQDFELFASSIARDLGVTVEHVLALDAAMRAVKTKTELSAIRLEGWTEQALPEWAHWVPGVGAANPRPTSSHKRVRFALPRHS